MRFESNNFYRVYQRTGSGAKAQVRKDGVEGILVGREYTSKMPSVVVFCHAEYHRLSVQKFEIDVSLAECE